MAESASRLVLWLAASAGALSPSPRARSLPARAVRAPAGLSLQPLAPRARALTRRASDMERSYDGVDLGASDATDVMDDEGWFEDDDERDAAIDILADRDENNEEVDTSSVYFFGNDEDDDEELRRLLSELESQFAGKDDAASRSILASVEECGKVLEKEHTPVALDARAALAFAATARGDAPVDELDVERIPTVDDELVEAFQALNTDDFDGHLDEMYSWLVGNSSEATHAGSTSSKTRFGRTVGLDLGTTNSAAAVVDADGAPKLLPPGLTPSVVCFIDGELETEPVDRAGRVALRDDDGRGVVAVVGKEAEQMRDGVHAASVCSRVKRVLARDATPREMRRVSAGESEKLTHTTTLRIPALPNRVAASEVSAEVVRKLRDDALAFLDGHAGAATKCVVGVPARFDEAAIEATKTACLLGGFESAETILEPVAAALAYSATKQVGKETVLVFDLGGGTFDCCVVELDGNRAELIALGGDAKLGGDDFDAAVAEHLADRFYDAHGLSVKAATARLRLLAEAERCKIALSRSNATKAFARGLARVGADGRRARGGRPLDLECDVTRPVLDALCQPLVARLEKAMRATCAEAGVALPGAKGTRSLDGVLLVGGATRTPAVGRMLRAATGLPLAKIAAHGSVHPDEAVALGAAVRAAALDASSVGAAAPDASVVDKRSPV